MKRKFLSLSSLLIGFFGFSQTTEIYFKYDEAGNQRYRGPDVNAKQSQQEASKQNDKTISVSSSVAIDEKYFWKQVRLYPVPVNTVLTIDWNDEVDGLIESVSLYQHSTVHWKFQQQNLPNLNKHVKIDMTGYEWGVYIVRFTLKDGRVLSKNITKR
ncbi:hypothetical protein SAMN05443633_11241 [Chryseobacterium arachidis]|uniref:Por secretion system C-terminal sorting domain-containing protein n=1 Tax=Chryseobacterium arachidis TaxID=1416778 RepID=A0A1M5I8D4_9FLAO|nr:hypothetical protein [Chryseobacterium arachidis]SHG24594.1 hypothetical protein SAMN05443633_11241 [Chryseobacterium arachidis]